ncbi:MAG: hypothetical protein JWL73_677 [Actinomycetia bacterium]|nr:hypothetical protein [Actinomycetes bacterium]
MRVSRVARSWTFMGTAVLVAAACLSGPPAGASPAAAAPPKAVTKAVLKKSDLPAGWKGKKASSSDSGSDATDKQLATCFGFPAKITKSKSPTADAPDFTLAGTGVTEQSISSSIAVSTKTGQDAKIFAALQGPKGADCLNQAFSASIQKSIASGSPGVTVTNVSTTGIDVGTVLDRRVGFHFTATVSATDASGPVSIPVNVNIVFAQRGKYVAEFAFSALGSEFDPAIQTQAINAVANRIKKLPA